MPPVAERHRLDRPDKFGGKVFVHKVAGNKNPTVLPQPRSPLTHHRFDGLHARHLNQGAAAMAYLGRHVHGFGFQKLHHRR